LNFEFFFLDPIRDPIRDPVRDPIRDPVRDPPVIRSGPIQFLSTPVTIRRNVASLGFAGFFRGGGWQLAAAKSMG